MIDWSWYLYPVFMVFVMILLVVVPPNTVEVNDDVYGEVDGWMTKQPELIPMVKEAILDDTLSIPEYWSIQEKYEEMEGLENSAIKERLKEKVE